MKQTMRLSSADNPRIKAALRLRKHRQRTATGLFLAEGLRELSRAVAADLTVHEVFVCPSLLSGAAAVEFDALTAARQPSLAHTRWYDVTEPLLRKLAYQQNPQGLVAVVAQPRWSLASLVEAVEPPTDASQSPPLWLIAMGTTKPGNLGAMVRTAEAAGAWGVLAVDAVVDPFNPNAIRASTAAVFHLPVIGLPAAEAVAFLRRHGVRIVAATPEATTDYSQVDLTGPVAIAIGAEDAGLDAPWREAPEDEHDPTPSVASASAEQVAQVAEALRPDVTVAIPTCGRLVDSLNASVAAGVLLFEAVRQRRAQQTGTRPK